VNPLRLPARNLRCGEHCSNISYITMGSATIRAKTIGFCFLRRRREAGGEIPPAYSPGMPSPTFLAFVPMGTLAQNDDLLNLRDVLHEAEGEAVERMQQIARAAYAHTENNLYAISVW